MSTLSQTDLSEYKVYSRKEILALLRAMQETNLLVTLMVNGGSDAILTSVLDIDERKNYVFIDRAPSNALNQKILDSKRVSFESVLENIRILFSVTGVSKCMYDGGDALRFDIPDNLIRLQRREFFRVPTPITEPIRCRVTTIDQHTEEVTVHMCVLANISVGGLSIVDEEKRIDNTLGRIFEKCQIDLPGLPPIDLKLQVRNAQDLTYANGRSVRRLGCMFVNLSKPVGISIQRFITRLEREINAKELGLQ